MSTRKTIVAALLATATMAPCLWAQEQQPLQGDILDAYVARDVRISGVGGKTLEGAVASIHDGRVEVLTRAGARTMALNDIVRIERRGDSIKNGFIAGAAVGGLLGFLACVECEGAGIRIYAAAMTGSIYGLAGAGIDALHDGWTPLYVRRDKGARANAGKPRAMISLRVRF